MKKIVQTIEVQGQGLEALLGEKVTLFCANYIYNGKLIGVNTTDVLLEDAYLVFETGEFNNGGLKTAEYLAKEWRVRTASVESYGVFTSK